MTKYVAYYRVSTQKQGQSGLGLDAQRSAVQQFVRDGDTIVSEFVEVESGKNDARPKLAEALAACKRHRATLLIAKLDRLARRLSFIATLMDGDVAFVATDNPAANKLTLHILAAVAEAEADAISARTKAALQAAKKRGIVLGGFRGVVPSKVDGDKGRSVRTATARQSAMELLPVIEEVRQEGASTLRDIATALNARGIPAARGGLWQVTQVARMLRAAA